MNSSLETKLIKAGLITMPAWLLLVTVAGFLATDYSAIASHASVMTLQGGVAHSLVNVAAWISGLTLILFGIGIWIHSRRVVSTGAICWILFGISMVANGTWPMGSRMHGLYIIGLFNILAPALTLLDLGQGPLQEKLRGITAFTCMASMFYLWMLMNGFDPEGYAGLTQRVFGSISYAWPMIFAVFFSRHASK